MRYARSAIVVLTILTLLGSGTLAAERRQLTREPVADGVARGVHHTPGDPLGVQGFSPGKANRLSALAPWVETAGGIVDTLFFDDESLTVSGSVFTDKDRDVKVTIEVLNTGGTAVFQSVFTDVAFPGEVVTYFADVGVLNAGFYQVRMKFKQGKKSVGVRFWFRVDVAPPPGPAA